jgi:serine/threonine-protein kinase
MSLVPAILVYRVNVRLLEARRSVEELGAYRLVKKLGAGGMGEVWEAEHMTLARPAAIKLIKPKLGQDETTRARSLSRFKREAKATAALNSAHTVNLFDYGVNDDGTLYYVMELLHGMDLDDFVIIPPNRTMYFLEQVCGSLAEAHTAGLVHRDIKPSNLYLCHIGLNLDFVKVFDFGLVSETSSEAQSAEDIKLTAEGNIIGTPAFLAPEMARAEEVDQSADIYSLGCVAYWLLTGDFVFPASSPFQMVINHMSMVPEPPSTRTNQPIPKELDDLILTCLAKNPRERPSDAEQLRNQLRGILIEPWTEEQAESWWRKHPRALAQVDVSTRASSRQSRGFEETVSEDEE